MKEIDPFDLSAWVKLIADRNVSFVSSWSFEHPGGYACQSHAHSVFEIVYHFSGCGEIFVNGENVRYESGGCSIYSPQLEHRQKNLTSGRDICLLIAVEEPNPPPLFVYIPELGDSRIRDNIDYLSGLEHQGDPLLDAIWNCAGKELLLSLLRYRMNMSAREGMSNAQIYAHTARRMILQNLDSNSNFSAIARKIGVSEDYLRHVFRECFGIPMCQFQMQKRLEKAQKMLFYSNLTLKEIAEFCGFANERYLCRVFKQHTQMTPGAFKRKAMFTGNSLKE